MSLLNALFVTPGNSASTSRHWATAVILATVLLAGCTSKPVENSWQLSGPTMGTTFSITIADPDNKLGPDPDLSRLSSDISELLTSFNKQLSTYDPTSEISAFNQSRSTEPFEVSPWFAKVVGKAKEIHHLSEGRFDITIAPLVNAWGFGSDGKHDSVPSDEAIHEAQSRMGSDKLHVSSNPSAITKDLPEIELNVNAIAPGYASDLIAELCRQHGYANFLIDVGGEFRASGRNASGNPWRVAIERPIRSPVPEHQPQRVLALTDQSVATSGDYRQYFEVDGVYYSHTLDPRTGRPVSHGLASVSVVAHDCLMADALATAITVLGPDEGMKLVESLNGVEALMLVRQPDGSFAEIQSPGLSKLIVE